MTTPLITYTQDAGSTLGRGIDFSGILGPNAPLGSDTLLSAVWTVYSGAGSVTGSTVVGNVAAALFTSGGAPGSSTIFKCVATTTKGQSPVEFITITST